LISLFGKEEFDPPGARKIDPWTALKLSGFWMVLSLVQVALSVDRTSHFRSSGHPVSAWREATVWFWVVILMFWVWNGWTNFRKYRDQHREDEAAG
jgi:hypothetical protein